MNWINSCLDEVSNTLWNCTCNPAAALRWLLLIRLPLASSVLINASRIFTLHLTCGFLSSLSLCSDFYQLLKATIPTSPCSFLSMTSSKFLSPGHFHKLFLSLSPRFNPGRHSCCGVWMVSLSRGAFFSKVAISWLWFGKKQGVKDTKSKSSTLVMRSSWGKNKTSVITHLRWKKRLLPGG